MANSATAEPAGFGPAAVGAVLRRLLELAPSAPLPALAVAWSGGADSTALIHALTGLEPKPPLRVLHIDHGLQADSAAWARHCRKTAAGMGIDCEVLRAGIGQEAIAEYGVEAAARRARYALLAAALRPAECLATAQHREDQLETVLLQLLRGAGLPGLAAMAPVSAFGPGTLVRPLLAWDRAELVAYLQGHGVHWIEDPANRDLRFDRSFLRHEVLPLVRGRWPAADSNAARSAGHLAEGAELLEQLAAADLAACDAGAGRLERSRLSRLPVARRRNALRYWLRSAGYPAPDSRHLARLLEELVDGPGELPRLRIGRAEVRRYRERLYLMPADKPPVPAGPLPLSVGTAVELPAGLGRIRLEAKAASGLDPVLLEGGCEVRFRSGGERLAPMAGRPTRRLKQLLQEAGIVPWMRDRIPLVHCGGRLVAIADLWVAADCRRPGGVTVVWEDKPPLY